MTRPAHLTAVPDGPGISPELTHSSPLRFLLIEEPTADGELIRGLLEHEFPHGGIDVVVSLELALRRLAEREYDLVLADLTLPDAEGELIVRAVRVAFPQIPLMVLTRQADGTRSSWTPAGGDQDHRVKSDHGGPCLAEALLRGLHRSNTEQLAHAHVVSAQELEGEAAKQLRELDTAKNDVVATASHELRTPSGLGLHIAASIVENQGGNISVDSAVGRGTTFTVRSPAPLASGAGTRWPVTTAHLTERVDLPPGPPGDDPDLRDVEPAPCAPESARQTAHRDLLGNALGYAQARLAEPGATRTGVGGSDAPPENLAGQALATDDAPLGDASDATPLPAAYVGLLLQGKRREAVALAHGCATDGMDASEILLDILEPALREVGRLRDRGLISSAQEDLCTAVTQCLMTDLYPGAYGRQGSARRLVAVHAPGSLHHVGLRMVADVLECQGWSATCLGEDVTVEKLIALLSEEQSDVLLVTASVPGQLPHLGAMIRAVRHDPRTRGVKIVVGGQLFLMDPELVDAVGADCAAPDARSAIEVCHELGWGAG